MPEPAASSAVSTETSSSSSATTSQSTADIAASVISDIEQGGDGGGDGTPVVEPGQPQQTQQAEIDQDDFDQAPKEVEDALGRKRENKIPHSRVEKMIARREQKLIAKVAKELGITKAEAELKFDDVLGGLTERNTKFTEYEERVRTAEAIEAIMEGEPERFVRMLAQANPEAYGRFAAILDQQQTQQQAQTAAADDDPEPEPDYPLGNGQMTYSREGLKKLREWERRQGQKETQKLLDERLTPFERERKQREERERLQQTHQRAVQAVDRAIERAMQWPGFEENQEAIAKLITEKNIDLVDAYMQVVVKGKLSTDRTKMRQELLDEINAAPNTTSASTASAVAPQKDTKAKTTADFAREEIARLSA